MSTGNRWATLRPGDVVKISATVSAVLPSGCVNFVIEQDAEFELVEQAKSPGEKAYDAYWGTDQVHIAWGYLSASERARWEGIADAARS